MNLTSWWSMPSEPRAGALGRRVGVLVPLVLLVSILGAAVVAGGAAVHVAREAALAQQRAELGRAMDVLELMLVQRARDLGGTVTRIANDRRLAQALLSGSAEGLMRYVQTQVRGGALDQLVVMSPGMPATTYSRLSGAALPPSACDRSQVAGALVAMPGATSAIMVTTRDGITDTGIPLRVCAATDLAASGFLNQVARVTASDVSVAVVGTHVEGVQPTLDGFTRSASSEDARLRLTRRMRLAGEHLVLAVSHRDGDPATSAILLSPSSPLTLLTVAVAVMIALWCWYARRAERRNLVGLCQTVTDGVLVLDDVQRIVQTNDVACELLGVPDVTLRGEWLANVLDVREENTHRSLVPEVLHCLNGSAQAHTFECTMHQTDNTARPVRMTVRWLGSSGKGLVVINDITAERDDAQRRSRTLVRDNLTGVLTEFGFRSRLEQAIGVCASDGEVCSILQLELSGPDLALLTRNSSDRQRLAFELINVLYAGLRTSDLLAQLDAERFAVLLPGCGVDDALAVAESLRTKVRQFRYVNDGRMHELVASIGVVQVGNGLSDVDALTRAASFACELARGQGHNQVQVYQMPGRGNAARVPDREWADRIRQALDEDRFELFAQPLQSLDGTSNCTQLEVLLRMRTDDGSFISPAAFLPVAERQSLAEQLDARVIEMLFERYAGVLTRVTESDAHGSGLNLTVNVSAASVANAAFADDLEIRMRDARVPRGRIGVEVTETTAVSDLDAARRFFTRMRGLGCLVILDDFGNNASSLGRLRSLPADCVKLDALLLRDVVSDAVDRALVRALCEVAASLDVKVVAHYVQNPKVLAVVRELGVDFVQGFAVCAPRPLSEWLDDDVHIAPMPSPALAPLALVRGGREH